MAGTIRLRAGLMQEPPPSGVSGAGPLVQSSILDLVKTYGLTAQVLTRYALTADAVAPVSLGPLVSAHVLLLSVASPGAKVKARITTADGAVQVVPFDDLFLLVSLTSPVTALDLQRTAGVDSFVDVYLGSTS